MSKDYTQLSPPKPLRKVRAEDLVNELTQDNKAPATDGLDAESLLLGRGRTLLPLRDATVTGTFDLKHRTVHKPLEIQGCVFEGDVDLRYCEFEQVVNFSGSTFEQEFNSGDEIESHTIFRKDLICIEAVFEKSATFGGVKVEGSAYFSGAYFNDTQLSVDFTLASFEKTLECSGAVFGGSTVFTALRCNGNGVFSKARFEGKQGIDFTQASFGVNLNCNEATFTGPTSFNRVKCDGYVTFEKATFADGAVSFVHAAFGDMFFRQILFEVPASFESLHCSNLFCEEVSFREPITFNRIQCDGYGEFRRARFFASSTVEFTDATFSVLSYVQVAFDGSVNFDSLKCSDLYCSEVLFRDMVIFSLVECSNLFCDGARFEEHVRFDRLKCEGSGFFRAAEFSAESARNEPSVSFELAHFGTDLNFREARFAGSVNLSATQVSRALVLTDAIFESDVSLYGASIDVLALDSNHFPFRPGSLDLRECAFNRFRGSELEASSFAESQDPTRFSRDPYLNLERYYQRLGNDARARRLFYRGRSALREAAKYGAKDEFGNIKWAWTTIWWKDFWLKCLTGYGVKGHRLLFLFIWLVTVGTIVFWSDQALQPVSSTSTPSGTMQAAAQPTPTNNELNSNDLPKIWNRVGYSTDLLIPSGGVLGISFFDLGLEKKWAPAGTWREGYAIFHRVAGWLIILLIIMVLTGVARRL